jgi:sodium-coupled monocarboxylate transporter 8/12
VVIYAPSIMLAEMTGFSVAAAVIIVGAITTVYTVLGGVKGVIYTDLLQASLFLAGWAVVVIFIVRMLPGGVGEAWNVALADGKLRLLDLNPDPRVPATVWTGAIAMLFTHLALGAVNQAQVQKFLTVSGMKGGRRAILFHAFTQLGIYVAFFALGTMLYVFYRIYSDRLPAGIAPDRVLPAFIMRELPGGLRGLLIVAAFSAAMSTVSSAVNALANVTLADFMERRGIRQTILRAKVISVVWGVLVTGAGLLAWRLGSILELIVKVNSYFYGCLLGVFLLGMLNRRIDGRGARAGLAAGIVTVLVCSALQPSMWIWFGAIGCLACMTAGCAWGFGKVDDLRYRPPQRARH